MQVNIGEKIKELRKRDGRKQEDLANALGITAQAVSRWEAGGCYPDMNLIPAIANYFHVSIDALFGYQNDREGKINAYVQEAFRLTYEGEDLTKIIQYLRNCLEEFPGEPKLQKYLAGVLQGKGFSEAEIPNPYLEEAVSLYEELSKHDCDAVEPLVRTYARMGKPEKAESRAEQQPRVSQCREMLLATLYDDDKGARYRGEAILSLLHSLEFILVGEVARKEEYKRSGQGVDILETLYSLYEKIFEGKNYGIFHSDLCMISLYCSKRSAQIKDYDRSLIFFDRAVTHYSEYAKIMEKSVRGIPQEPHYESPLLSKAEGIIANFVICKSEFLKDAVSAFPAKLRKKLSQDPKYAMIFQAE